MLLGIGSSASRETFDVMLIFGSTVRARDRLTGTTFRQILQRPRRDPVPSLHLVMDDTYVSVIFARLQQSDGSDEGRGKRPDQSRENYIAHSGYANRSPAVSMIVYFFPAFCSAAFGNTSCAASFPTKYGLPFAPP
jgi:hypothetical protein